MRTVNCAASACRNCRFYQPEGRRGGQCQQLGVPVRGGWKACSLALSPFAPSWESLEEIWTRQEQNQQLAGAIPIESSFNSSQQEFEPPNVPATKISTTALLV